MLNVVDILLIASADVAISTLSNQVYFFGHATVQISPEIKWGLDG